MSEDNFEIGLLLGRRQAFGVVAGRCTAAKVEQMRDIRDRKLYLGRASGWEEFCVKDLHISKGTANRMIRCLEEFGPTYFVLSELTEISPTTYRTIAPSIEEDKLRWNGEVIALIPENAGKVTAAVQEMRKTVTVKPVAAPPGEDSIQVLEEKCSEIAARLERAIPRLRQSPYMRAVVLSLRDRLNRMEMTI
jgi:hypothetical protein